MAIFIRKTIGALVVTLCTWVPTAGGSVSLERSANSQQTSADQPTRTWSDSSGKYRIEAAFLGYVDGQVRLRKTDGSQISVPLERLCDLDCRYVRLKLRSKSPAARKPDTSPGLTAEETSRREAVDRLVRNAIVADMDGQSFERDQMLAKAVDTDPKFAPARWLSGQVLSSRSRESETWLSVEHAEQLAAADPLLSEYARRRDEAENDAKSQEALALWCRKQGLVEQEKIHWRHVLDHDPNHRGARRCLQLRDYEGRLLTREQISAARQRAIVMERKRKEWMPKLNAWRRAVQGNDEAAADEARRAMQELRDPDLVGLLESYLSLRSETLSRAVVEVLANIPAQTATDSLVRHAVESPWSSVNKAATTQLQQRPKYSFVPTLIDAMSSPLKLSSWEEGSAIGYTVEQEGKNVDQILHGSVEIEAVQALPTTGRNINWRRTLQAAEEAKRSRAEEVARQLRRDVERNNEAVAAVNEPIRRVLTATTGQDFGLDPSAWYDWWNDYHENQVQDKLVITRHKYDRAYAAFLPVQSCECFPAGTVVRTERGQRLIDEIKIGDLVLSQNPDTGELTYKPVVGITVRPASELLEIGMGGEILRTTKGHPMWVGRQGWRIAKFVRPGDRLHRYFGSIKVESVREIPASEDVYNLVVDDFHSYFVGENSVLVHDNSVVTPPGVSFLGEKSVAKK